MKASKQFNRQEALDTCVAYYVAKGYSEEHSIGYVGKEEDWQLERIYNIICEEMNSRQSNE